MMAYIRRGYELKTLFFGRPVRPFHLAITISTGAVGIDSFFLSGLVLYGWQGALVGWLALVAAILMVVGWWWTNDDAAEWGLLLSAGVWTTRAVFALISQHAWFAVAASTAWVVGSVGAYLLERYDHETGSRE